MNVDICGYYRYEDEQFMRHELNVKIITNKYVKYKTYHYAFLYSFEIFVCERLKQFKILKRKPKDYIKVISQLKKNLIDKKSETKKVN